MACRLLIGRVRIKYVVLIRTLFCQNLKGNFSAKPYFAGNERMAVSSSAQLELAVYYLVAS